MDGVTLEAPASELVSGEGGPLFTFEEVTLDLEVAPPEVDMEICRVGCR